MIKLAAFFLIRFTSAFFRVVGGRACRFHPSCSQYAEDAYRYFGVLKATGISLGRLSRCHPFSKGGWDPLKHTTDKERLGYE